MAPQALQPIAPSYHDLPTLTPRFLPPTNSTTLQSHIQIYAIPYGVLGVFSHALTFHVILCHLCGRRPLLPWQNLQRTTWNIVLVTLSSLISMILSAVTLARARGSQPLMTLAGMQIVLGVLMDAVHVHRFVVKSEGWNDGMGPWGVPMVVTAVFLFGRSISFLAVVREEDGKVGNIFKSIAFLVLLAWIGLTGLATSFNLIASVLSSFKKSMPFAVSAVLFSCALFWLGDFGIATVSKNSLGTPSTQVAALYYAFWIVERLPLFTF